MTKGFYLTLNWHHFNKNGNKFHLSKTYHIQEIKFDNVTQEAIGMLNGCIATTKLPLPLLYIVLGWWGGASGRQRGERRETEVSVFQNESEQKKADCKDHLNVHTMKKPIIGLEKRIGFAYIITDLETLKRMFQYN